MEIDSTSLNTYPSHRSQDTPNRGNLEDQEGVDPTHFIDLDDNHLNCPASLEELATVATM